MNAGIDLERRLSIWLTDGAPDHAPDEVLTSSMELVSRAPQVRPVSRRLDAGWLVLTPRRRVLLVAAAVLALVAASVVAGAILRHTPVVPASSLVVVRGTGDGIEVVAIPPDGGETTVASFGNDHLGGSWSNEAAYSGDGWLALQTETGAADSQTAIVDLRDPSAPARFPDASGYVGVWGPDGRVIARVDEAAVSVYDVASGTMTRVAIPAGAPLISSPYRYAWTADGTGFAAEGDTSYGDDAAPGGVRPPPLKTLLLDGEVVEEARPVFQMGMGPRRVRDDGAHLRCRPDADDSCGGDDATLYAVDETVTPIWSEQQPAVRVADFAWATDGGLWILTETIAAGPRKIELIHVGPDGTERTVSRLGVDAGPDDPDPNAYLQGGVLAAMAPDDSRIVVDLAGTNGASGAQLLIDTATGATTAEVEGTIAGWMGPDDLAKPRPTVQSIPDVPAEIQGDWARVTAGDGTATPITHRVTIGHSNAVIDPDAATSITLSILSAGPDQVRFLPTTPGLRCEQGISASYRWAAVPGGVTLAPISDDCRERRSILTGSFERNLPYGGNHEPKVTAGSTFLVPELGLRLTIPTSGDGSVWNHGLGRLALSHGDTDHWQLSRMVLGVSAMCAPFTQTDVHGGIDGVLAYLDRLGSEGVELEDRQGTTVAGLPATVGILRIGEHSCGESLRGPDLFGSGLNEGGFSARDGERITIFTTADGTVWVLATYASDATSAAWADALTASLEFVQATP